MAVGTNPDDVNTIATIVSGIILGVITAFGATYARSAHKRGKAIQDELIVPPSGFPGPTLKVIEEDLAEQKDAVEELGVKVDHLNVSFARHEGAHEGLLRDIERVMRRVYKENGDG